MGGADEDLGFVGESSDELFFPGEVAANGLDHAPLFEVLHHGQEDLTHAPPGEALFEDVAAEGTRKAALTKRARRRAFVRRLNGHRVDLETACPVPRAELIPRPRCGFQGTSCGVLNENRYPPVRPGSRSPW